MRPQADNKPWQPAHVDRVPLSSDTDYPEPRLLSWQRGVEVQGKRFSIIKKGTKSNINPDNQTVFDR